MKLDLKPEMTFEAMAKTIQEGLPQYQTEVKKNPLMGFQYVQVRKSGTVGVWIRTFDKKNRAMLMNAMPSFMVRAMLGGLLLVLFTASAQTKVRKEVGALLIEKFGTKEQ